MSFGGFNDNQHSAPMADINVTPMVDVMLVLLVIFIITAPLLASSIRLDLPRSDATQPGDVPQFVILVVDKSGQAFLNDQPVSTDQLAQGLQQSAARNPDTEVQLRADQAVPYGRIVEVMGIAQKAGLNRIGFVADVPSAARP
ncbi:MAG: biopolymer transporter ExbD [Polaromonas sp.]|nr:biopolymer transporter ExbD [Polaromonas sp.]